VQKLAETKHKTEHMTFLVMMMRFIVHANIKKLQTYMIKHL